MPNLRVDFQKNIWDRKIGHLNKERFTSSLIKEQTGLTIGQVNYRRGILNKGSLSYRRGLSPEAKRTLQRIDAMLGYIKSIKR